MSSTTRSVAAVGAVVLCLGGSLGALGVPVPAAAAPAPCERSDRYAAESGSQLIRVNKLDPRPAGIDGEPTTDVALGEAKSALIADGTVNAAAVTRMLNSGDGGTLSDPLIQFAPPTHKLAARRKTAAVGAGPFTLGNGTLVSHAQWDAGMACGAKAGHVTRAAAGLTKVGIAWDLMRVPGKVGSSSTTALEKGARTVATSAVTVGAFDLLGGAVRVQVVRAPSLLVSMSTRAGGEVRYTPAVLEVSGEGLEPTRLDTPGDDVEIALGDDLAATQGDSTTPSGRDDPPGAHGTEPGAAPDTKPDKPDTPGATGGTGATDRPDRPGATGKPGATDRRATASDEESSTPGGGPAATGDESGRPSDSNAGADHKAESTTISDLVSRLPTLGGLTAGPPLPIPAVPGVPPVADPETESAQVAGQGTRLHITLGDVRHATSGHAIAARATAIKIVITQGRPGYGDNAPNRSSVILDLDLGVLEAAAVTPEPSDTGARTATAGGAGGLPITGPRVAVFATAGAGLLLAGAVALLSGRRRRFRATP
jgi:hypothetical protein